MADDSVEIVTLDDDESIGTTDSANDIPTLVEDGTDTLPRNAKAQADGSIILTFDYPVTLKYVRPGSTVPKEEEFTELHFHRIKGADIKAISMAAQEDRQVVTIARSARIRLPLMHLVYDAMDGADVIAAAVVVGRFLGNGRTTGR
jgi:hypothetical protein